MLEKGQGLALGQVYLVYLAKLPENASVPTKTLFDTSKTAALFDSTPTNYYLATLPGKLPYKIQLRVCF